MYETLDQVRSDVDARLLAAASQRKSPMHTPVVATADADARVMVLRHYDPQNATLRFHTDARAPKAAAIGAGSPVGVLFYDRDEKVQIRCQGEGRVEREGAIADAAWAASDNFARRCYLGEGPGAVSATPTSGLPARFEGVEPNEAEVIPARQHFAVLLVALHSIDWFYLAHTGHIRAQFQGAELSGGGGRWVAP